MNLSEHFLSTGELLAGVVSGDKAFTICTICTLHILVLLFIFFNCICCAHVLEEGLRILFVIIFCRALPLWLCWKGTKLLLSQGQEWPFKKEESKQVWNDIEFSRTHPLWIKSLKFYNLKEKNRTDKDIATRQCSIYRINEVLYPNRVRKKFKGWYTTFCMQPGSLNTKMGVLLWMEQRYVRILEEGK